MVPSQAENAMLQEIRHSLERNQIAHALDVCRKLNSRHPRNAEGWVAASVIAGKLNNIEKSLEFVDRALALQPSAPNILIAKANLLVTTNRLDDAKILAQQVVTEYSRSAQLLDMAGTIFSRCGDHDSALRSYEKAISLEPDNSGYYYNLAAVKRFLGDDEGAESAWDRAIALNPADYDAHHLRSDVRKQTRERNHIAELERLIQGGKPDWRGAFKLHYALAKEYEDLENYGASFSSLKKGADLRRKHMPYRIENDVRTIDRIIDVFSHDLFAERSGGFDSAGAIFIVGLPRTGSTLVDRIISSHDQVHAAGELNNFAHQMTRMVTQKAGRKLSRDELVDRSANIDWNALGHAYMDSVLGVRGETRYFTDKLPLNFLYCGLIHRALPQAKIIHVVRDPMDTCYAMYKRLFKDAYPMSYDLDDLGQYYLAYRRLMSHWEEVMPGTIYPIAYEQLINDQEQVSRRLIEHCGLQWQEACLHFQENTAPTTTASATQVRQPLYRSSVGSWRHYSRQLAPLQELLRNNGIDVGE